MFEAVFIGSSAGGIEALEKILPEIPEDFPASVYIAQHVAPKAEWTLATVLQKKCKLAVKYPMDEEFYRPSVIYLAPPGHHMLLTYKKIWIFPANFVYLPKPNIDLMFQSGASEFGKTAIGIILSGAGNDGAIGIQAIKERGGTTIAQNKATSQYFNMPESAIKTGSVDFTLPPEVIGSTIVKLVTGSDKTEKT